MGDSLQSSCVFCDIACQCPPRSLSDSSSYPASFDTNNIILSTETYIAFLDIQPLISSECHVLAVPRKHSPKLSDFDLAGAELSQLGEHLALLAQAVCNVFKVDDYNIIQNNGAAAGQVVPHVHFHIVARRSESTINTDSQLGYPASSESTFGNQIQKSALIFGKGPRHDLDDDDAKQKRQALRKYLQNQTSSKISQ
ncbi:HIT-like domain-containing protein [Dipodascopsis uninucleata]